MCRARLRVIARLCVQSAARELQMAILIRLAGLALGAAGMYLFDPGQGRRRRAVMRDQVNSRARSLTGVAGAAVRDLRNRMRGGAVQLQRWSAMQQGEVPDRVLVARVRARIGRNVSHPKAVRVEATRGTVTLRGPILAAEHHATLRAVRRVRGIQDVQDLLQVHESAAHISALQGAGSRRAQRAGASSSWSPAMRVVSGSGGAALVLMGLRRGGITGMWAGAAGALMLTRALTNRPLARLAEGIGRSSGPGNAGGRGRAGGPPQPSTGEDAGSAAQGREGEPRDLDASGWQSPVASRTGDAPETRPEGEQGTSSRYPQPGP
jgi:hypothetical protein